MDKQRADGRRIQFMKYVQSTPILLVGSGNRWGIVIVNESSANLLRVGYSGTIATEGIGIPAGQSLSDTFSTDEYWAAYSSGQSGTVSGFYVP